MFGGVLVPEPGVILPGTTDGGGSHVLTFPVPPGVPSGASLTCQYWILDPSAIQGWSASGGLRGNAP
ncbi:MAG TPA: hypothetical protein VFI25_14025 [Planctomycetota bacterium]|nr:hypothetical protein [Planctomycetota bacterium]